VSLALPDSVSDAIAVAAIAPISAKKSAAASTAPPVHPFWKRDYYRIKEI